MHRDGYPHGVIFYEDEEGAWDANIEESEDAFIGYEPDGTGYGVFHFAFRVKGKPGTDYPFDDLPETTRLLKAIKEHYKQGRGIYAVSGVFFPDEMP